MTPKTLRVHDRYIDALLDTWGFQEKLAEHDARQNFRVYPWYSDEDGGWAVRISKVGGPSDAVKKTMTAREWWAA